jgi:hypothetical protein
MLGTWLEVSRFPFIGFLLVTDFWRREFAGQLRTEANSGSL